MLPYTRDEAVPGEKMQIWGFKRMDCVYSTVLANANENPSQNASPDDAGPKSVWFMTRIPTLDQRARNGANSFRAGANARKLLAIAVFLAFEAVCAAQIVEFSIPTAGSFAYGIAGGRDGTLWFAESNGNKMGRIPPAGAITEFPIPTAGSTPQGIAAGPDGNLWFVESAVSKIGRITTAG